MDFEKGHIYHIYNQGNNRQKIFFNRENYLFFLSKIKKHILPYADIFAWCLMPNHFHLMVLVNKIEIRSHNSQGVTWSHPLTKPRSLNNSIGIMLRSYTRAINKQEKRSGSLFRETTKAECLTCTKESPPSWFMNNGTAQINISLPEKQYPQLCFNYIHLNPVRAGLVKNIDDWEFSSAKDYFGLRDGKIINNNKANEFLNINQIRSSND